MKRLTAVDPHLAFLHGRNLPWLSLETLVPLFLKDIIVDFVFLNQSGLINLHFNDCFSKYCGIFTHFFPSCYFFLVSAKLLNLQD